MKHVVHLPAINKRVPLGAYVAAPVNRNSIVLPRRYVVELELCTASDRLALSRFGRLAWRLVAAGAIAAITFWTVAVTVGDAAPTPRITQRVTLIPAVLTPVRQPLGCAPRSLFLNPTGSAHDRHHSRARLARSRLRRLWRLHRPR